jgi:hypothetical protein
MELLALKALLPVLGNAGAVRERGPWHRRVPWALCAPHAGAVDVQFSILCPRGRFWECT